MNPEEPEYGPVVILAGKHAGRVGYLDDTDVEFPNWDPASDIEPSVTLHVGCVYFGEVPLAVGYAVIPLSDLRPVNTHDLVKRRQVLHESCSKFASLRPGGRKLPAKRLRELLTELHFVETTLLDRLLQGRFGRQPPNSGSKAFISYSSADRPFATWLATDLKEAGHTIWLDEWKVRVGDSIPTKISEGISEAQFVIVVLSASAVKSHWVAREWQAKYWHEVEQGQVMVLPALIEDCDVPVLLRPKKYADFRTSFQDGLADILHALHTNRT